MGRFKLWFGGVFALFGLVFTAIGGGFWWSDHKIASVGLHARGEVVGFDESYSSDNGTSYRPRVTFLDADGQRHSFTSKIGSNPPSHDNGEQVEVIYDPAMPERALIDSFSDRHLFPLVFGGIGMLCACIGVGVIGWGLRRRRMIERLKRSGLRIEADFTDCYRDTSVKVNGRSPWRVTAQCKHPGTGKLQVFTSDMIWADPGAMLKGRKVPVLVDPQDDRHYYVDLEPYLDESALG